MTAGNDDTGTMKVVKKPAPEKLHKFTLRLNEALDKKLAQVAGSYQVSKQQLIEAILKKALSDKNFSVEIED